MNKGQGIFAGALVAAALLLRPGTTIPPVGPSGSPVTPANGSRTANQSHSSSEGPWLASCQYWAAVSPPLIGKGAQKKSVSDIDIEIRLDRSATRVAETENSDKDDPGCGDDNPAKWGVPEGAGGATKPDITTILVMVPDPVHTHYAMEFDRTVNAILQAATDNSYVSSYYWLPWPRQVDALRDAVATNRKESGHDPLRERQPGLIVLRHVPGRQQGSEMYKGLNLDDSYSRVIFLFLVSETPTTGIDGFQLQNALSYESQFASRAPGTNPTHNTVYIVGPRFSGSAAPLAAGLRAYWLQQNKHVDFQIMGATSTELSVAQINDLNHAGKPDAGPIVSYHTFSSDGVFTSGLFDDALYRSGYDGYKIARLIEDTTFLGGSSTQYWTSYLTSYSESLAPAFVKDRQKLLESQAVKLWESEALTIRFPLEISLLRNAEADVKDSSDSASMGSIPSPYLHFSAKDSSGEDSVPQFSRENTPMTQEAELMAIARQFRMKKIDIVFISASNILDEIFLVRFLHRADPDALFVVGNDLLMARDVDNGPYIGALAIGPYPLIGMGRGTDARRPYTDSTSIEMYNAASYIIWKASAGRNYTAPPSLQGYNNFLNRKTQPLLWATVIGRDGYYPVGVLSLCASNDDRFFHDQFLPQLSKKDGYLIPSDCATPATRTLAQNLSRLSGISVYPSLAWEVISWTVIVLCFAHALLIFVADYWSPITRDLAIRANDQPERRALCINVSMAAIALMDFVTGFPGFALFRKVEIGFSAGLALWGLSTAGVISILVSAWETSRALRWHGIGGSTAGNGTLVNRVYTVLRGNAYLFLVILTWAGAAVIALLWFWLCSADLGSDSFLGWRPVFLEGLSFSYRCVYPASGVSPLVPVFLLLLAWYIGGIFQTWRLRFSEANRPHLTSDPDGLIDCRYVVTEQDLSGQRTVKGGGLGERDTARKFGLCNIIECPLFVARLLRYLFANKRIVAEAASAAAGAALLIALCLKTTFTSFDRFLWSVHHWPTPYELLTALLVFPLLWISFSAWLRLVFVWAALKRDVLTRLENQPLRFAFNHLQEEGWMAMLGRAGLREQWRDIHRCIESMSQILNLPNLRKKLDANSEERASDLRELIVGKSKPLCGRVTESEEQCGIGCELTTEIDLKLAKFGKQLLVDVLSGYWSGEKVALVEYGESDELPIQLRSAKEAAPQTWIPIELQAARSNRPLDVAAAEEFVAIRYMSLIRSVLANLRYLMIFVSFTFVLSTIAWNSYPFQPRQLVDWLITGLLVLIGSGIIWVFAQMHRDPILSRLTNTKPNELGWDFYLRIVAFGAIPVLTWLAYEFPDVGSTIYRIVTPGVSVFK